MSNFFPRLSTSYSSLLLLKEHEEALVESGNDDCCVKVGELPLELQVESSISKDLILSLSLPISKFCSSGELSSQTLLSPVEVVD
ncbi:hypothetical protein WICPIJ_000975 [Wickerhamomyces pijperi]|uniref:Uncharacterized protein n=1 Tax=Wickerhamomyces pijperi TaxID=599730 RepID=A0A9P8QEJ8_WICPI|nr:hypothetical protein WICPIJ_000975 [Wickerhamomyces pijperi]